MAIACKTGDGTSGLKDDDAFAAMRKELENFADIMFSGRPGTAPSGSENGQAPTASSLRSTTASSNPAFTVLTPITTMKPARPNRTGFAGSKAT